MMNASRVSALVASIVGTALFAGACNVVPDRDFAVVYEAEFNATTAPDDWPRSIRYRNADDEMVDVDVENHATNGSWSVGLDEVPSDIPAEIALDPAGDDGSARVRILVDGNLEAEDEFTPGEDRIAYATVLLRRLW